ncbi:hypothetical protein E1B28_010323 [Marasmius oreades]|uniref:MYND-type domain-containing protein n=1 Tax=Marasmius oreades TaxID=181124 RepID=A0A9P7RX00_9AGAR|nr:uncharacterized protein E1B28_010323 [Marasmius oreades]KAG7091274.1 hypothetical protein E1B28_010323 [Marasmius oreades]
MLLELSIQDRPPLSNALVLALDSGKKDPSGLILYQCRLHNTTNCKTCFDWINLAIANLKKASTRGNVIAIEATREEKLGFLSSMGVELSPNTRLPEEAVDKRLRGAIDGAQYFYSVIDEVPVNPASFPMWSKTDPENKPLVLAVRRGNFAEVTAMLKARGENPFPLYQNAFMDVRQTLMTLGKHFDDGHPEAVLQDKGHDYAICMRVLEVRKVALDVPMFVVTYGRGAHNQPLSPTFGWISDVIARSQSNSTKIGFPQIISTPEEQNLLLSILQVNSKRLSADYVPDLRKTEKRFMVSFFLPIGPLSQLDIGKLANCSGCIVCGNKTISKCSGCLSVEYCGRDCQKLHWKEHKPMCVSLKGGTWHTVTVSTEAPEIRIASLLEGKPLVANYLNNQNPFHPSAYKSKTEVQSADPTSLPPNIHGDRPFLVKIQCPFNPVLRSLGGSMLIYDRQRSFHAHFSAADDQATYDEAMKQPGMATQLKIYRWAKRVGDCQLSICFDRPPSKDPLW